ncbi:MAG: hypothetical protein G8D61_09375 [gamma proteobacterium symbiont of Ctena orbiculata]
MPATAAVALLLVIAIGSLIFVGQNGDVQPEAELEETSLLEPGLRQKVEGILEVAEVHLLVGRLLEPPGSSAYDAYQQVLDMHQYNKQATQGLQQIGDLLEQRIRDMIASNQRQEGQTLLQKSLAALPKHQGLISLQQEL